MSKADDMNEDIETFDEELDLQAKMVFAIRSIAYIVIAFPVSLFLVIAGIWLSYTKGDTNIFNYFSLGAAVLLAYALIYAISDFVKSRP